MPGGISVAGDYFDFLLFTLLIFHLQLAAIGRHDLHFQLAVSAIQLVVAGPVGERILIADVVANILEVLAILCLKTRKVGAPSGYGGEGAHSIDRKSTRLNSSHLV